MKSKPIYHSGTDEPVCPWCGKEQHRKGIDDDYENDCVCEACEKPFVAEVEITREFYTHKVLNTQAAPCGLIAEGKTQSKDSTTFPYKEWLFIAQNHWETRPSTRTIRCSGGRHLFTWTIFPWGDE